MKKKLLTLALIAGLVLSSFSASFAAGSSTNDRGSSSSSSSSSSDSDSSSSSSSSSSTSSGNSGATSVSTNASGQTVTKNEYSSNGVEMTVTTVGNDGTTLKEAEFMGSGTQHVMLRTTEGGSAVGPNGEAINTSPILVITENGVSVGCFVNPTTGLPLATGQDAVYWAYDANGNLVVHYVNAQGYFYTGTHIINGQTFIFNDEGVIIG